MAKLPARRTTPIGPSLNDIAYAEANAYGAKLKRAMNGRPAYTTPNPANGLRSIDPVLAREIMRDAPTLAEYDRQTKRAMQSHADVNRREAAFMRYLVNGHAETRDLGYLVAGAGGYLVPPGGFYDTLSFQYLYSSAIVSKSRIWNSPTGNPATFALALSDATSAGSGSVNENTQLGETDLAFTNVSFSETIPFIADDLIRESRQLIEDSAIDLPQMIADAYAFRLGAAADKLFMNTALTNGSVAVSTTAANTAPTIQDLNALLYSLNAANRNAPNSALIVSKATALAMRNWTDNTAVTPGRPLLLDSVMTAQLADYSGFGNSTLSRQVRFMSYAGVPILESPNVADFSAGATFGIFANFDAFFLQRIVDDSIGIQWLHERYADFGQVAALGSGRFDGAVADFTAGVLWKAHA